MSGLLFKLRPNTEIELKDCAYTVRNEGIYPVILRVYEKSKLAELISKTPSIYPKLKPTKTK